MFIERTPLLCEWHRKHGRRRRRRKRKTKDYFAWKQIYRVGKDVGRVIPAAISNPQPAAPVGMTMASPFGPVAVGGIMRHS